MKSIIACLERVRTSFGLAEESVESIMKPLTKIADKLERHERAQIAEAQRQTEIAKSAADAAAAADQAAKRAAEKRATLSAFAA